MISNALEEKPLSGKCVAVTGASRGIGAAAASALAAQGATVALLHHPSESMTQLAGELADTIEAADGSAQAFPVDLVDPEHISTVFDTVRDSLGPPDILINNAAASRVGPWDEMTVGQWDEVMAVNVRALWLCSKAVAPGMSAAGWGRIINVSSIEVTLAPAISLAYVSSKAAVIGFTRSLARALGSAGVCVNAVMPGSIRTEHQIEMFGQSEEFNRFWVEAQCIPRRGTADDLAGVFSFLSSTSSDFVTGQVLTVDGGATHY